MYTPSHKVSVKRMCSLKNIYTYRMLLYKSFFLMGYLCRRIQSYLNGAASSLDLCMYVMTCDDLTKSIVAAHRRNVCVRIIVDSSMSENPACDNQLLRMRRAGMFLI